MDAGRSRKGEGLPTTVEVTLAPQGLGTAVRIVPSAEESKPTAMGGQVNAMERLTLYDRRVDANKNRFRCEWCGRSGQPLPFHVQSPDGDVKFAEPVLCEVCQGLLGYLHPHRTQQPQPPTVSRAETESLTASDAESSEERLASAGARRSEVQGWASGVVSHLLTERFVQEGRPRPEWALGPGWEWPPSS